jgi:hypothetical protein
MTTDQIFHEERNALRKVGLLLTIPCAILPMLAASMGLMQPGNEPLFFAGDKLLFGIIYLFYAAGLWFSWKKHRNAFAAILFILHLSFQFLLLKQPLSEWIPYVVISSIILTSVVNQYYRVGTIACKNETCTYEQL